MHMKTLLITGFAPFGGETINPAWAAEKALPEQLGGFTVLQIAGKLRRAEQIAL